METFLINIHDSFIFLFKPSILQSFENNLLAFLLEIDY